MIQRFQKVTDGLYRGSAPSVNDVKLLKKKGIKKIVSLDLPAAKKINRICRLLNIKHVITPITNKISVLHFLKHNLKHLLIDDGPTFVHCHYGKDRTGLVCALYECEYLNKSPENAIKDAKKLDFGVGVPKNIVNLYEKIIKSCKSTDVNNADIVSNEREQYGDVRNSPFDEAQLGSFAPTTTTRQYPIDEVYNELNEQSPTRQNYNKLINKYDDKVDIPAIGQYNNNAGVQGFGPAINAGGFIYD